MTDPLGQSQVLPYLAQLSKKGYAITLLSFEKRKRYASEKHIIKKIANDGGDAVSGTFNGLPEGSPFTVSGTTFLISYQGGSGSNDVVLLSSGASPTTITSVTLVTNGFTQLKGSGQAGLAYSVEGASNLNPIIMWTTIGSAVADGSGAFSFTDTNAPSFPMRFYRVLSL